MTKERYASYEDLGVMSQRAGSVFGSLILATLVDGPPPAVSIAEVERLQRLNNLRRTFAHFNPQGWSIELKLLLLLMPVSLNRR